MQIIQSIVGLAAKHLIEILLLLVGLRAHRHPLGDQLRRGVFWRGLLAALVGVPALALAVGATLPLTPLALGVILLLSVCPGAPIVLVTARLKAGNLALSAALMIALSMLAVLTVPLALRVVDAPFDLGLRTSSLDLLRRLGPSIFLPLALGLTLRAIWPAQAERLAPAVGVLFLLAFGITALLAVVVGVPQLLQVRPIGLVAAVLVTAGSLGLGHLAGGPAPEDRTSVALATAFGNPMIALLVAQRSYPELRLVPVVFAYVILRALVMLVFLWLTRRHRAVAVPHPPMQPSPT